MMLLKTLRAIDYALIHATALIPLVSQSICRKKAYISMFLHGIALQKSIYNDVPALKLLAISSSTYHMLPLERSQEAVKLGLVAFTLYALDDKPIPFSHSAFHLLLHPLYRIYSDMLEHI
jgi:hypothetical protein